MTDAFSTPALPTAARWGELPGGQTVQLYTLEYGGLRVQLSDYGARIVRVLAPDRHGQPGDVTLGQGQLEPYLTQPQARYFGAVVGRYANRIAGARFSLDGREYHLSANDGPNTLHGGPGGFHARLWAAQPLLTQRGPALDLTLHSQDGDEGYPGALEVRVRYTLTREGELLIEYQASCDAPTVLNLTNHAYWNLQSGGAGSVLEHTLQLPARSYLPVDATLIPLGERAAVQGSPFDFNAPQAIGGRIGADDEQLRLAGGYDHSWVLDPGPALDDPELSGPALRRAALLHDPASGRRLEILTTQPGLQVYSGNFIDGTFRGHGGVSYGPHSAVCLETQHFPDSPHRPDFPSTLLRPGEVYRSATLHRFSVDRG